MAEEQESQELEVQDQEEKYGYIEDMERLQASVFIQKPFLMPKCFRCWMCGIETNILFAARDHLCTECCVRPPPDTHRAIGVKTSVASADVRGAIIQRNRRMRHESGLQRVRRKYLESRVVFHLNNSLSTEVLFREEDIENKLK